MIVIGILLVAAGAVFGLDLLWKYKAKVPDPVVFGNTLGISSGRWLILIGVIVGASIALGVALLIAGLGRKRAKAVAARNDKSNRHRSEEERETLQADNAHLRRQLDQRNTVVARPTSVTGFEPGAGATSLEPPDDETIVGR